MQRVQSRSCNRHSLPVSYTHLDVYKRQIFSYKGKELFRGIIMSQQQSDSRKMPITAYYNGIYLSNNKDTFVYENKTVHDIFIDVCKRFGIKSVSYTHLDVYKRQLLRLELMSNMLLM